MDLSFDSSPPDPAPLSDIPVEVLPILVDVVDLGAAEPHPLLNGEVLGKIVYIINHAYLSLSCKSCVL